MTRFGQTLTTLCWICVLAVVASQGFGIAGGVEPEALAFEDQTFSEGAKLRSLVPLLLMVPATIALWAGLTLQHRYHPGRHAPRS